MEILRLEIQIEDVGAKKFVVGRFLDFKMMDSRTVINQVQEIQAEGMILNETFHVATIIEKLPLGWKNFKNYLKHKRKEINLEELIVRLRIEKDNRDSEKRGFNLASTKATVVRWVTDLWIVDFQGGTTRTMRLMWWITSLKMFQTLTSLQWSLK